MKKGIWEVNENEIVYSRTGRKLNRAELRGILTLWDAFTKKAKEAGLTVEESTALRQWVFQQQREWEGIVIEKADWHNRGYGTCTFAMYKVPPFSLLIDENPIYYMPSLEESHNGWNYAELCRPTGSDYQRHIAALPCEIKVVGRKIGELISMPEIMFLTRKGGGGKWHRPTISMNGEIERLSC